MRSDNNDLRMELKEALTNLWNRIKGKLTNLDERVETLEEGSGGGEENVIESVSVNGTNIPPVNKNVNIPVPTKTSDLTNDSGFLTQHQDISGKKNIQSAVSDPTASGSAVSFIDTITQNAQGVITPTKKTVPEATQSASGLMSTTDKAKLDGLDMLGFYIDAQGYICQRIGSDT